MAAPSRRQPRRRRLGSGLVVLLLLAAGVYGYGEYRAWQLRDSCTGNAGSWDRELQQCTFRGGELPAPPPSKIP